MRVGRILGFCLAPILLGIVLLSEYLVSGTAPAWLNAVAREVQLAAQDAQTRWAMIVCLCTYFVTFVFWEQRLKRAGRWWRLDEPNLWLVGLVALGWFRYVLDYENTQGSTAPLVLLAGIVLGQGAWTWVRWHDDAGEIGRRALWLVGTLVWLLAGVALWQPPGRWQYQYRGELRWDGPWVNPNTYGLLMATGMVLAAGFLVSARRFTGRSSKPVLRQLAWMSCYLVATGVCGFGLLKSYSRGAWLAALIGISWIAAQWAYGGAKSGSTGEWLRRNGPALVALLLSASTLAFWLFRDTEWRPARRVFSVANINDFSWRNRVTAWEGALQMMVDRPCIGFGWDRPNSIYAELYCPPRLVDPWAIRLNDYFTLGMSLGLPALLCLAGCVGLRLRPTAPKALGRAEGTESWQGNQLEVVALLSRAGAVTMLVGFWFSGGMFHFAVGPVFWTLLMLGSLGTGRPHLEGSSSPLGRAAVFCALLTFLTALGWATARDPFRRVAFSVRDDSGRRTDCLAVLPKGADALPVVIYAHDAENTLETAGDMLRLIAEQGVAAVGFEYDKTSRARFGEQLQAVLARLWRHRWADTNSVAWIGQSHGAQYMLSVLAEQPQLKPRVLVALAGAAVPPELWGTNLSSAPRFEGMHAWFVHREGDSTVPLAAAEQTVAWLRASGATVRFHVAPYSRNTLGPNEVVLVRAAAEHCAAQLGAAAEAQVNVRPLRLTWWIPVGIAWLAMVGWWSLRRSRRQIRPDPWLQRMAWGAGVLAVCILAFRCALLGLPATGNVLQVARHLLVPTRLKEDFEWLAAEMAGMPATVGEMLDHLELADLRRNAFGAGGDIAGYRQWVLSSRLDESTEPLGWRRLFWESFYPRVRRQADAAAAADTVVQHLRSRVTVTDQASGPKSVADMWRGQVTTPAGFEKMYVAALRSVGIAARVGRTGRAELCAEGTWKLAPRPFLEMLNEHPLGQVDKIDP